MNHKPLVSLATLVAAACSAAAPVPVEPSRAAAAAALQDRFASTWWVEAEVLEADRSRCVVVVRRVLAQPTAAADGETEPAGSLLDQVNAALEQNEFLDSINDQRLAVGSILRPYVNVERHEGVADEPGLVPGETRWLLLTRYFLRWHLLMIGSRSAG